MRQFGKSRNWAGPVRASPIFGVSAQVIGRAPADNGIPIVYSESIDRPQCTDNYFIAVRPLNSEIVTRGLLYVVAYVLLDWMTYVQPVLSLGITPWNPQAGITLALLILYGPRLAWLTAVAAAGAELLVRHGETPLWAIPLLASAIAVFYSLAAALLRGRGFQDSIDSPGKVIRLLATGAIASLGIGTVYVGFFAALQPAPHTDVLRNVARYAMGDLNGILTVTPLLLALPKWRQGISAVRERALEVIAQVGAMLVSLWAIFGLKIESDLHFSYPVFIPAIWIAFRWGFTGTILALLAIHIAFIAAAAVGSVSFSFMDVQVRLLSLGATVMLLAAAVTERLAAERQLRERDRELSRATRFAVAGELTSALAHELNQPITALVSYTRAAQILAEPIADKDARLSGTLEKAAHQAIRAADIMKKLRDFYRSGISSRSLLDVREVIDAVLKSHEERLRQHAIRCTCQHDAALSSVQFDATQLEMILHNVLNNAIEALVSIDNERNLLIITRGDQQSVFISIADSGPGIADEVRPELFEPFVTTRTDGMGLGLALGRSLLRSQGGDLWAEECALGGACFVMRIDANPAETT